MISSHIGEFAALITAFCWTITALAFTDAGKRIGSLSVNFWRLVVGIIILSIFVKFRYNYFLPQDISVEGWMWLSISGFVGIFLGDLFLFKSFTIVGPRVSLLIMSLSPPLAAVISWFALGELLSITAIIGMSITMIGIIIVILTRGTEDETKKKRIKLKYSSRGIFYAVLGSAGQATGLVMSKLGVLESGNPFAATQVRLYAGIIGFIILISFLKRWKPVIISVKNTRAFASLSLGAFFGPFLGISFSLIAVTYTNPGIVQTITSINPVLIIPFSIWLFKEKVSLIEFVGAIIAVTGVYMFFL